MPKYIVIIAIGEDHPCLFSEIRNLVFCRTALEVQEALPRRENEAEDSDEDFDWMVFEIVPGSDSPKTCSIIFEQDGRTIKSISSNGIHP